MVFGKMQVQGHIMEEDKPITSTLEKEDKSRSRRRKGMASEEDNGGTSRSRRRTSVTQAPRSRRRRRATRPTISSRRTRAAHPHSRRMKSCAQGGGEQPLRLRRIRRATSALEEEDKRDLTFAHKEKDE